MKKLIIIDVVSKEDLERIAEALDTFIIESEEYDLVIGPCIPRRLGTTRRLAFRFRKEKRKKLSSNS